MLPLLLPLPLCPMKREQYYDACLILCRLWLEKDFFSKIIYFLRARNTSWRQFKISLRTKQKIQLKHSPSFLKNPRDKSFCILLNLPNFPSLNGWLNRCRKQRQWLLLVMWFDKEREREKVRTKISYFTLTRLASVSFS